LQFTCSGPSIGSARPRQHGRSEGGQFATAHASSWAYRARRIDQARDGGGRRRAFTFIDDAVVCLTKIIDNPGGIARQDLQHRQSPQFLLIRKLAEMMLESPSRGRNTLRPRAHKLVDISALDYYARLCRHPARCLRSRTPRRTRLDPQHGHARQKRDFRFLRHSLPSASRCCPRCLRALASASRSMSTPCGHARRRAPAHGTAEKIRGRCDVLFFGGARHTGRAMRRVFRKGCQQGGPHLVLKH